MKTYFVTMNIDGEHKNFLVQATSNEHAQKRMKDVSVDKGGHWFYEVVWCIEVAFPQNGVTELP